MTVQPCTLPSATHAATLDDADARRLRQEQVERWSAMVAGILDVDARPAPAGATAPEAPPSWRSGVGRMTPVRWSPAGGADARGACPEPVSSDAARAPGRVQLRLQSPELGEVAILVERGSKGVRVLIASLDARAVAMLDSERAALQRAIAATGVVVQNIKVVQMQPIGTVLAPSPGSPEERASRMLSRDGLARDLHPATTKLLNVTG